MNPIAQVSERQRTQDLLHACRTAGVECPGCVDAIIYTGGRRRLARFMPSADRR